LGISCLLSRLPWVRVSGGLGPRGAVAVDDCLDLGEAELDLGAVGTNADEADVLDALRVEPVDVNGVPAGQNALALHLARVVALPSASFFHSDPEAGLVTLAVGHVEGPRVSQRHADAEVHVRQLAGD
jgi:hypothetical protein